MAWLLISLLIIFVKSQRSFLMKKSLVIFFILLLIMTTAACQPTPEKAAVIYAGDLEEKIARSSASVNVYDAPEIWQETVGLDGINAKITINANICVPDVTMFPIYKVEKAPLTHDIIQPLVDYFVRGRDVVKAKDIATKTEIEEQMIYAKKADDETWYEELEAMYEQAPETVDLEYITDWSFEDNDGEINGYVVLGNDEYAGISVCQDYIGYGTGDVRTDGMLSANGLEPVGSVAISEADAIAAAERTLNELEISDMTAYSLRKAQSYSIKSISTFAVTSEEPVSKGYTITFVRSIGGIQNRPGESTIFRPEDEFLYTAPFFPEEIRMYIDEQGDAQTLEWLYPLTLTEKMTDNASLMPFSDVQQRIRDMLNAVYLYQGEPVQVDRIEMNMALINIKDSPEEAMYVPSWYIHCVQQGMTQDIEQTIVLNAVDGGRVQVYPQTATVDIIDN